MHNLNRRRLGQGDVAKSPGIQTIEEQAGTANTTGLDEGAAIHKRAPKENRKVSFRVRYNSSLFNSIMTFQAYF